MSAFSVHTDSGLQSALKEEFPDREAVFVFAAAHESALPNIGKPRLRSDNGSSYVSDDLADWLNAQNMGHVRGAPYHPQTQGKIERWHQTLNAASKIIVD